MVDIPHRPLKAAVNGAADFPAPTERRNVATGEGRLGDRNPWIQRIRARRPFGAKDL